MFAVGVVGKVPIYAVIVEGKVQNGV